MTQDAHTPSPRRGSPKRLLEILVGVLCLLSAMALTGGTILGIYRLANSLIVHKTFMGIPFVAFTLAFGLVAAVLWTFTVRILRRPGSGKDRGIMSPTAFRISAIFFFLWFVFVVWASLETRATWEYLLALPGGVMMVLALKIARRLEASSGVPGPKQQEAP